MENNIMKTTIIADNIINCGCSNLIHRALSSATGVYGVNVYPEKNEIVIDHTDETDIEILLKTLEKAGYNVAANNHSPDYCNKNK